MVHASIIEAKLSKLGIKISRWSRAEIRELEKILMDDEDITHVVPGRYFGGYAMLVATDRRLLMIDKRAFFMNLEDMRFDMISEVDFSSRLFDSTITIFTLNKQHRFTSSKYKSHLRQLTAYIQQQVAQLRQQQYQPQQPVYANDNTPNEHHFLSSHLHRPAFLRTPHTHKIVGATAMLAAHRSTYGYPHVSLTTHTQTGFGGFLATAAPEA
jgi:hypothetical protein